MTTRMKIWLLPAFFFTLFLFWYTPTGGPLSDAEVDNFIAKMEQNGSPPEAMALIRQFGEEDTGKHFIRFSYAGATELVEAAIDRIAAWRGKA